MAKTAIGAPVVHFNGPGETEWVNDLPVMANPNYVVYFNDFLTAQDYDSTNRFNQVKDAAATVAIVTDGSKGEVVLTSTATTDNDGAYIGLNQENFTLTVGKKLWMSGKVKGSSVADMDLWFGLSEAVATNPENVVADATHRIGFELLDGSAVVQAKTSDGTTASAISTGASMTDNTYIKLDLVWDGVSSVSFYVNDILRVSKKTTNLPAAAATLAPGFFELSGSATGTRSATMDYMLVVAER
jgi:hypothetical protein